MAGTLTISTLSDGTNSTSSTNCIQGSAKAWLSFSYISGVLSTVGSYNISSITRSSTGAYTVTMTTALASATYAVVCSGGPVTGGGATSNLHPNATTAATYSAPTSSTFVISVTNEAGSALADPYTAALAVFR